MFTLILTLSLERRGDCFGYASQCHWGSRKRVYFEMAPCPTHPITNFLITIILLSKEFSMGFWENLVQKTRNFCVCFVKAVSKLKVLISPSSLSVHQKRDCFVPILSGRSNDNGSQGRGLRRE
jgi:hypothetical protein